MISGQYRGRVLKGPRSLEARPTSDRMRETLFNILAPRISGARFLDLFAGTGAVGIEASSRGARSVILVERSRSMQNIIVQNLRHCGIPIEAARVHGKDVADFLVHPPGDPKDTERFDIIFMDPPYEADYLSLIAPLADENQSSLDQNGLLIVEHHHKSEPPRSLGTLVRNRLVKQGESCLSFYEMRCGK